MSTASVQRALRRTIRRGAGVACLLVLLAPALAYGQELVIPGDTEAFLNDIIMNDTERTADRVYVLERGGIYLLAGSITNDFPLRIRGQEGEGQLPVIYNYANPETGTAPGNMIVMQEHVWLENLVMVAYLEGVEGEIDNMAASMVRVGAPGFDLAMDNVVMSQNRGQFVRTESAARTVKITNSIFANSGYLGLTNLGAGKAVDLRAGSIDTLLMVNNTFVNFQDRIVRHYRSTAALNHLIFDHNTIINHMGYHGVLALGLTGERVQVTNNLFVDGFALGADSTDAVRQAEFDEHGERYPSGTARMAWIFNQPVDSLETEWVVSNNFYTVTPEGQAFFDRYEPAQGLYGEGAPLTWHINRHLDADSVNAFTKIDLELADTPELMVTMMEWYRTPKEQGGAGRTKDTDTFDPTRHDWDRRGWEYFITGFDASYPSASPAYTGATGGYPAGDLNWFPDRKADWEEDTSIDVERVSAEIPGAYRLEQNYPNPFNPSTSITYALPQQTVVSLAVYNALGQEVARLVSEQAQAAGHYTATWNGTDHAGRMLPTGIYFYQLRAGEVVLTRKMVFVK